jgi:hypothetical protein
MVIVPKELLGIIIFPQHIFGINQTNVYKVHIKYWHVQAMAKNLELLACFIIN